MKLRSIRFSATLLVVATVACGTGLPPLPASPSDFNYSPGDVWNSYTPEGAPFAIPGPLPTFYGTPIDPAHPRLIDPGSSSLQDLDSCYGVGCVGESGTSIPVVLGYFEFLAGAIVPGTGIESGSITFTASGPLTHGYPGTGLPFASISAAGTFTLFTGDDPGGLSSYAYFETADATFSNVLHLKENTDGFAYLYGIITDPQDSATITGLQFAVPNENAFLTAPVPEPPDVSIGPTCLRSPRRGRNFAPLLA